MRGDGLHVRGSVTVPEAELRWRFSRSGGPGGQGVNTTDSRVELSLDVSASAAFGDAQRQRVRDRLAHRIVGGVVTVVASEHRSQRRNRDTARARLAGLLRDALAPDPQPRRATRPSRTARERRRQAKRHRGEVKRLRRPPEQ